ncbi:hypothetical protein EV421DRAFT_1896085 [Armillaria borealis]|uniref:Uncharacterized protein n=1 Tax=Armillaria borealis TaxID=47425 RepID=A0AA39N4G1_9AGAR|nr:hypothetical protein EV421DRAFT_1896085 [Armillaria borealis]
MRHSHWHNCQNESMYDDEEDGGGYLQGPKYWSNYGKTVFPGIKLREDPYDLADLPGKYIWVYDGHPEFESIVESKKDIFGSITVTARNNGAEKFLPEHIEATLVYGVIEGAFKGIVSREVAGCENCFYIESVQWSKEWSERVEECGHGLSIAAEEDDNGHSFLVFYWNDGYAPRCKIGEYGIIAKKVSGTNDEGYILSEGECGRLGIECTVEEVKDAGNDCKEGAEEIGKLDTKRKASDLLEEQANPKTRKTQH